MSHHSERGRFPRTMQEAFGPHTDNVLHPMPEKQSNADIWVSVVCILIVLAFVALVRYLPGVW